MERRMCAQICRRITDKQLVCTCHSFYISPLGCAITVPMTWLKVFWNVIKLWDHCDRTRLFWAKNGKMLRWNTQLQLDSLIWLWSGYGWIMRYQRAKQAPLSGHWIDTVWHPTRINLRDPGSVPPLISDRSWIWLRSEFLQFFSFSGNIPQRYFWYSQCTLYSSDSSARSCSPWLWPKQCLAAHHHTGVSSVELIARAHECPQLSTSIGGWLQIRPYYIPLPCSSSIGYICIYIYMICLQ